MLWSPSGTATVLQNPSGQSNNATRAINASGQSVGFSGNTAVLWSPSGKATVLQNPPGQSIGIVWAINAAGQSAGDVTSNGPYNTVEAVLWSPTGQPTVLQDAGGYGDSGAYAINNSGQSAGFSFVAPGSGGGEDAVLWSPTGKATVFRTWAVTASAKPTPSTTPVRASGFLLPRAAASPAARTRCCGRRRGRRPCSGRGRPWLQRGRRHQRLRAERWVFLHRARHLWAGEYEAVLWSPSGKATVLPDVGGYGESAAVAVNASGWSIGYSCNFPESYCPTDEVAALWSPTGAGTNLGRRPRTCLERYRSGWAQQSRRHYRLWRLRRRAIWLPARARPRALDLGDAARRLRRPRPWPATAACGREGRPSLPFASAISPGSTRAPAAPPRRSGPASSSRPICRAF